MEPSPMTVTVLSASSNDWKWRHSAFRLAPPPLVEAAREDEHVADRLLGDPRCVDAAGVGDGDAVVGERLDRDVVRSGEGTREQLQPVGVGDLRFLDRDPGDDAGLRNEFALGGGRPRESDVVVREMLAKRLGVRFHRQSFGPLAENDDIGLVTHGGYAAVRRS